MPTTGLCHFQPKCLQKPRPRVLGDAALPPPPMASSDYRHTRPSWSLAAHPVRSTLVPRPAPKRPARPHLARAPLLPLWLTLPPSQPRPHFPSHLEIVLAFVCGMPALPIQWWILSLALGAFPDLVSPLPKQRHFRPSSLDPSVPAGAHCWLAGAPPFPGGL